MNQETKICQNCRKPFTIEPDDFDFYEKIKVPPPTFCPECRLQRRLAVRNERNLYKSTCALCGSQMISMYSPDKPFTVYCKECWWGGKWDSLAYGQEYDFSRPFFEQFHDLLKKVPRPNLIVSSSVGCDYCNYFADGKNCYLCFGSIAVEDCLYGSPYESKNCVDTYLARECEFCYECIDCEKLSNSIFCQDCSNSFGLFACFDCKSCQDCIGCVGLRNKKFNIFNKGYSKEEYEAKKNDLFARGRPAFSEVFRNLSELKNGNPHRFATMLQCSNATGDHVVQSKNSLCSFDIKRCEDCRYCMRMIDGKDTYDTNFCEFVELGYEYIGYWKTTGVRFSNTCGESVRLEYSDFCVGSSDLFGCVALPKKQYCILNKQYTKEEYESIIPKIKEHMVAMPYKNKKGEIYRYGEFFPVEFSPFAYNESIAQDFFSLSKKEIADNGYLYKESEARLYKPTIMASNLPDSIRIVADSIASEVIECLHKGECNDQCTTAFKITPAEFSFYRRMNLPLPQLCPNCRHYERLRKRLPFKLWSRKCQCVGVKSENGIYQNTVKHQHGEGKCSNEFETSYAPDRKEIVYCESCYNSEVV